MSLKYRLLLAVSATLLLFFIALAICSMVAGERVFDYSARTHADLLTQSFFSELEARESAARSAVQTVAMDPEVLQTFAARDRGTLLEQALPVYESLGNEISQLFFHLPDQTTFLRLNNSGSELDPPDGYLLAVEKVNESKSPLSTIEKIQGALGYYTVIPLFIDGSYIGTAGMGGSLDIAFLESLKTRLGSEFCLYEIDENGPAIIASTALPVTAPSNHEIESLLSGEIAFRTAGDKSSVMLLLPLRNFNGDVIGLVQIDTDHSIVAAEMASLNRNFFLYALGALFLTSGILLYSLRQNVLIPLGRIQEFLNKAERLELSDKLPESGHDEISDINRRLNNTAAAINEAMSNLRSAHRQTLTILDSINALVYVSNYETYEILYLNNYGRNIFGGAEGQPCFQVLQQGQAGPCSFCKTDCPEDIVADDEMYKCWEMKSSFNNRHYECHSTAIKWLGGDNVRLVIATDITERKIAEELIFQSREWYRTIAEDIPALVTRYNPDFRFTYINNAYSRFVQLPGSEIIGRPIFNFIPAEHHQALKDNLAKLTPDNPVCIIENTKIDYQKRTRWMRWIHRAIYIPGGGLKEYLAIGEDVTSQKINQARLEYMSMHDALTGVFNKAYYDNEIKRLEGAREYPVAIICSDLDGLKSINDCYGHRAGDNMLKECASILKSSIRHGDILARFGGDEFVIIMPRTDLEAGEAVIRRIIETIDEYNRCGNEIHLGLSIGLAVSESPEQSLEGTFEQADRVMYKNKQDGALNRNRPGETE